MLAAKQIQHSRIQLNSHPHTLTAKYIEIFYCYALVIVTSVFTLNTTNAAEIYTTETLPIEHRSPLLNIFAFSRPDFILSSNKGSFHWLSRTEIVNYISATNKKSDFLLFDGETLLVSNAIQYQFDKDIQLNVSLPWIKHYAGFSDRFIYAFHDIFHLPQNGRTSDRHNEKLWIFNSNNQEIINSSSDTQGIGDLKLKLAWTPAITANIQITGLLKLPSGRVKRYTGSEEIDLGFSFLHQNPDWFVDRTFLAHTSLSLWYGLGYTYTGKTKLYEDIQQKSGVFTARVGSGWKVNPKWQIKMQFDTNSPLFKSKILELGWYPAQLSFAGVHTLNDKTAFDFIIAEDIRPRSAPDVIFSFGLKLKL